MNISYKWLKEYVDFNLTPQEDLRANRIRILTICILQR